MHKKIWIWNHYATNMFFDEGGRHYWFAHYLQKEGYEPTIFCASTIHNSDKIVNTKNQNYLRDEKNGIPFVFVKTPPYKGNGKSRVMNMLSFYRRLFSTTKKYAEEYGKPDVILASSVHPLTLVAGIKIAKKLGVPCICEVRDLWPESLIAYGSLKRHSLLARLLYRGEKWIYKRADEIVFTVEGGKDYIKEREWDVESGGPIKLDKVHHINNGVDLDTYEINTKENTVKDDDLTDCNTFKVIYTGSIREVNNIQVLVEAAKYIEDKSVEKIRFIIYGDGDKKDELVNWCESNNIENVSFKGRVDKKFVPYILSCSNINILHYQGKSIWKYGGSQNKIFEYMASGKPILSTIRMGYDIIERYNCGESLYNQDYQSIGNAIIRMSELGKEEYQSMCNNAKKASHEYDFRNLAKKLVMVIESV